MRFHAIRINDKWGLLRCKPQNGDDSGSLIIFSELLLTLCPSQRVAMHRFVALKCVNICEYTRTATSTGHSFHGIPQCNIIPNIISRWAWCCKKKIKENFSFNRSRKNWVFNPRLGSLPMWKNIIILKYRTQHRRSEHMSSFILRVCVLYNFL